MAYRQLAALTFAVLGLVAIGCGGNVNTRVDATTDEEQPPRSSDPPPNNAGDRAPGNTDQPPDNADPPPASAESPAGTGGSLAESCRQFCTALTGAFDKCTGGMLGRGVNELCSGDCRFPAGLPCQKELAAVLECATTHFDLLCAAGATPGDRPSTGTAVCEAARRAYSSCADNAPDPSASDPSAGCNSQPNDCLKCRCKAGSDLKKLENCVSSSSCSTL